MSELRVFGVAAAADAGDGAPAPARWLVHGELAALVADAASDGRASARLLREHWRILEEVGSRTTVLPIRFGTVVDGDEAVREYLDRDEEGLRARLATLAGRVQLTVKGTYDEERLLRGAVERSPEIARLRAQVEKLPGDASYPQRIRLGELVAGAVEQDRERDGAHVVARLEGLAVATVRHTATSLDGAVNAAFLVERARVGSFEGAVAELGRELGGRIRLRCVGPLPPYSFTETAEQAAWA